jgi:hypothetical protein
MYVVFSTLSGAEQVDAVAVLPLTTVSMQETLMFRLCLGPSWTMKILGQVS